MASRTYFMGVPAAGGRKVRIAGVKRINKNKFVRAAWGPTVARARRVRKQLGNGPNGRYPKSAAEILGIGLAELEECIQCGSMGNDDNCDQTCYDTLSATWATMESTITEIRHTGDPNINYGVFVKAGQAIATQDDLGEYMGEIIPYSTGAGSGYALQLDNKTGMIDAVNHGNWLRFVNHHCNPNAEFSEVVLGGRRMIIAYAIRPIAAGEEITFHYGAHFWNGRLCRCDNSLVPHAIRKDIPSSPFKGK